MFFKKLIFLVFLNFVYIQNYLIWPQPNIFIQNNTYSNIAYMTKFNFEFRTKNSKNEFITHPILEIAKARYYDTLFYEWNWENKPASNFNSSFQPRIYVMETIVNNLDENLYYKNNESYTIKVERDPSTKTDYIIRIYCETVWGCLRGT
jgi:hypothetical protein